MSNSSTEVIQPARGLSGLIRIPGDKSISHRYAMLAAIADGTSRFQNFSAAQDCYSTLGCMKELGSEWSKKEDGTIEVQGICPKLKAPTQRLDCGNS